MQVISHPTSPFAINEVSYYGSRSFSTGAYGPSIIIRVDNVAYGQTVTATARIGVEYEPGMSTAPYIADPCRHLLVSDAQAIVQRLFQSSIQSIKRIWTIDAYNSMLSSLDSLTSEELARYPAVAAQPDVVAAIRKCLE
jgi:hypothetical protein